MDISADLDELGQTQYQISLRWCQSDLDLPRTLEYLCSVVPVVDTKQTRRGHSYTLPSATSK